MNEHEHPDQAVTDLARRVRTICEPNRLLILEKILQGVQCNCDLGELLGMSPSLISHHVTVLREMGLITAEKDPLDGRWIYYSVNAPALEALQAQLDAFFSVDRIRPRQLVCSSRLTEEQRQSFQRMAR